MRVSLVYNSSAGEGVSSDEVRREIEAAGHRVVAEIGLDHPVLPPLDDYDLVAVAGGDGTVGGVVRLFVGRPTLLALLPLGTANNVASSLGLRGSLREQIHAWSGAGAVTLDVAVAKGPWGERAFVESAGTGLLAQGIRAMDADAPHAEEGDREAMFRKARQRFLQVLRELRPRELRLRSGGAEMTEELLLLEVLNIPTVGPGLPLSPAADPGDSLLDVLAVREDDRARLAGMLHEPPTIVSWPQWRTGELEIAGCMHFHVDDWYTEAVQGRPITLHRREFVKVLRPRLRTGGG